MIIDFDWFGKEILNRKLDQESLSMLKTIITSEFFTKDESIVSQGQPGGTLYILRSGKANVEIDANGDRIYIASIREKGIFGEVTFLTNEPASAYVIAQNDCVVYKITHDGFSHLMTNHHDIVYTLITYMLIHTSQLLRGMNDKHVAMLNYVTGRKH